MNSCISALFIFLRYFFPPHVSIFHFPLPVTKDFSDSTCVIIFSKSNPLSIFVLISETKKIFSNAFKRKIPCLFSGKTFSPLKTQTMDEDSASSTLKNPALLSENGVINHPSSLAQQAVHKRPSAALRSGRRSSTYYVYASGLRPHDALHLNISETACKKLYIIILIGLHLQTILNLLGKRMTYVGLKLSGTYLLRTTPSRLISEI